jgi:Cu/Ag efflux protein CusF
VVSTDPKAPSITIKEANGNTHSFRVKDAKKLEGINPGDKLAITYDEAVAIKVSAPDGK